MVLSTEMQMMEDFGVGRGTLREALRLLEAQGLITVKRGRSGGPMVQQPRPERMAHLLSLILRLSGVSFAEIVEARQTIEPELAAFTASRISKDGLQRLGEIQTRLDEGIEDEDAFLLANRAFHTEVADQSGNLPLASLWRAISTIADGHEVGISYELSVRQEVSRAHARIIEAIAAGDSEAASRSMARHLEATRAHLERYHPAILRRPIQIISVDSGS